MHTGFAQEIYIILHPFEFVYGVDHVLCIMHVSIFLGDSYETTGIVPGKRVRSIAE